MGLFTKNKHKEYELPTLNPEITPTPPIPITRQEITEHTKKTTQELKKLMNQYRELINGGNNLKLLELRELTHHFTQLAREFEKIYELMRFDLEKYEAIDKYNQQTFEKRKELIKKLEQEDKKPEEPPKPPKKGA